MRISDWSSDVCSSDLPHRHLEAAPAARPGGDDGRQSRPARPPPAPYSSRAGSAAGDRKSTRLTPVTNAHLVCRLLLAKKKNTLQKNTDSCNTIENNTT